MKINKRYRISNFEIVEEVEMIGDNWGSKYYSMLKKYGIWEANAKALLLIPSKACGLGRRSIEEHIEEIEEGSNLSKELIRLTKKLYEIWIKYQVPDSEKINLKAALPVHVHIRICEDERCKNWKAVYIEGEAIRELSRLGFYSNISRKDKASVSYFSKLVTLHPQKVEEIKSSDYVIGGEPFGELEFEPLKIVIESIYQKVLSCNEKYPEACEGIIALAKSMRIKYENALLKIREVEKSIREVKKLIKSPAIYFDGKFILSDLEELRKSNFDELVYFLAQELWKYTKEEIDAELFNKLPYCFPIVWNLEITLEKTPDEEIGRMFFPFVACKNDEINFRLKNFELYFFLQMLTNLTSYLKYTI